MWVKGASTYLGRKTFIWTQGLTSWDLSTSDGESKLELDRGCIPEAFGERQKERETERQTETAVQSLYFKKIVPVKRSKVFFFQRDLQGGNIRHPLFLFFSLLTSIEDKWGCGPDSVDKLVISGWSERHSSLEFFPSDLHFFFLLPALICIPFLQLLWSAFLFF